MQTGYFTTRQIHRAGGKAGKTIQNILAIVSYNSDAYMRHPIILTMQLIDPATQRRQLVPALMLSSVLATSPSHLYIWLVLREFLKSPRFANAVECDFGLY